jgi:hypothetical protein
MENLVEMGRRAMICVEGIKCDNFEVWTSEKVEMARRQIMKILLIIQAYSGLPHSDLSVEGLLERII